MQVAMEEPFRKQATDHFQVTQLMWQKLPNEKMNECKKKIQLDCVLHIYYSINIVWFVGGKKSPTMAL